MKHGRFELVQHHAGGQADVEAHIREAFADEPLPDADLPAHKPIPDLESAARSGQLGTLYLPIEHAMLEEMHDQADEHVKLREFEDGSEEMAENRTAFIALGNGADIHWYDAGKHDAVAEIRADLRW
jgi:hypothetical protein